MDANTTGKWIGTVSKERRRANPLSQAEMLSLALYVARRDNKPQEVGATAYGYKLAKRGAVFPPSHPRLEVRPSGDVYRLGYIVEAE